MKFFPTFSKPRPFSATAVWLVALGAALGAVTGCRGETSTQPPFHGIRNMYNQARFDPMGETSLFSDHRTMRPVPEGALAQERYSDNDHLHLGKVAGADATTFPMEVNLAVMHQGERRFNTYCTPCHGPLATGTGLVVQHGYAPATNLNDERIRKMPVGEIFQTITNGLRNMPSYASQISAEDRWAIIAYVRALERSQNATLADVPEDKRAAIAALPTPTPASAPVAPAASPADDAKPLPELGAELYKTKICFTCHSIDGSKVVGPSWKGIYGTTETFEDGTSGKVDDAYIRESILKPQAKVVKGFPPVMPSFEGQLTDRQIDALIAFIKQQKK